MLRVLPPTNQNLSTLFVALSGKTPIIAIQLSVFRNVATQVGRFLLPVLLHLKYNEALICTRKQNSE